MMKNENVLGQDGVEAPSSTNPQCKVCTSSNRFEIEVALASGESQEATARRFSRGGQALSRQNIHSHYRRHMEVIDRAVTEAAAGLLRNRMLDVSTAIEIEDQLERNRAVMRRQVSEQIETNQLRWSARDAMAFIEQDARLGEQRSAALLETFKSQASAFMEAVKSTVPPETWGAVVEAFNRLMDKNGGPTDVFYQRDVPLGEEARQA